jgi:hypothetical protein
MEFTGEVVVKPIPPKGRKWELVESFSYQGNTDLFTVPAGFETDFASVPRVFVWLLPRYGRWTPAAVLHDYLWAQSRKGEFNKFDADGIFNRALRGLEVPFLRRWIMWAAVRWAAGPKTWFVRGPVPFLKQLAILILVLPFVAPPALVVFVALVVGAAAEFVVYLPLRVFERQEKKAHPPDPGEILLS